MLAGASWKSGAAGILLLVPAVALACPICLPSPGAGVPALEQMAGAGALALAEPQEPPRRLKVASVLKGKVAPGGVIEIAYADMPRTPFEAGKAVIVARHPLLHAWRPLGSIGKERAGWLREALALAPASEIPADGWPARVRFFSDDLLSGDAFVAGVAANQIARAPYAAMRTLRGSLDGAGLAAAANRLENLPHLPLFILLMGIAGDEASRAFIGERTRAAGALANAGELAALLTARMEIEGEDALMTRGRAMLAAPAARPADIGAAVMALGVFAGALGEARRAEAVALYREALETRPGIAGAVARTMEDWRDWSLAAEIAQAANAPDVDEGSRLLIRSYLEASANASASRVN